MTLEHRHIYQTRQESMNNKENSVINKTDTEEMVKMKHSRKIFSKYITDKFAIFRPYKNSCKLYLKKQQTRQFK